MISVRVDIVLVGNNKTVINWLEKVCKRDSCPRFGRAFRKLQVTSYRTTVDYPILKLSITKRFEQPS